MFYKFLNSKDVDRVLNENTLLVSSIQYFRDLEATQGPWIGDRLDAATELTVPESFVLTEGSKELEITNQANIGLGMFEKGFAHVSGGGTIDISGATFVHQLPSLHVYSFAGGDLGELTQSMCVDANEPYDACLRIASPDALIRELLTSAEVLPTNAPLKEMFPIVDLDQVRYEDVSRDIRVGGVIAPHPLVKAKRFAPQKEHRALFHAAPGQTPDARLVVKIPDASRHFELVFRDFQR